MSLLFASSAADLENTLNELSINVVMAAVVLLVLLVAASMWAVKKRKNKLKKPLFLLILLVVASTTLTISSATVYLNVKSDTGGPVHWHADIEFWACGNEMKLRDPQGFLSNKIGSPTLHEHNDKRIHLEGVPISLPEDASLGKFMNIVGGDVSRSSLVVPLNEEGYFEDGVDEVDGDGPGAPARELVEPFIKTGSDGTKAVFVGGQQCGDETSEVQVFNYQFEKETNTYVQTKIHNPELYAITDESDVPPGDCIIFEFGPVRDRTDKLCEQYGVRDTSRCADFGVPADKRDICEITEIR
jgi:hypothetical protein